MSSLYTKNAEWEGLLDDYRARSQVVREKVINGITYTIYNHEFADTEKGKIYRHFLVYTGKACYDTTGRKYWWNKDEVFLGMYDTMGQAVRAMKEAIVNDMYL